MAHTLTLLADVSPWEYAFGSVLRWYVAGVVVLFSVWMLKTSIGPLFREIER